MPDKNPPNYLQLSPRQVREIKALVNDETEQVFIPSNQLIYAVAQLHSAGVQPVIIPPQVTRFSDGSFSWMGHFLLKKG